MTISSSLINNPHAMTALGITIGLFCGVAGTTTMIILKHLMMYFNYHKFLLMTNSNACFFPSIAACFFPSIADSQMIIPVVGGGIVGTFVGGSILYFLFGGS